MTELYGTAKLSIRPGRLDDFKRLAARCMEIARTKDSGTLEYDFFFNADSTECMVHERYRDSQAALEHSANQGPDLMQELLETCTITGEVCGMPGPELKRALMDAGVRLYEPYMSLSTRQGAA